MTDRVRVLASGAANTLAPIVLMGFTDISGAGTRALNGLIPGSGGVLGLLKGKKTTPDNYGQLEMSGGNFTINSSDNVAFSPDSKSRKKAEKKGRAIVPIEVVNITPKPKAPPTHSLLIVNTTIKDTDSTLVAEALVSYLAQHNVKELIVGAAVRFTPPPSLKLSSVVHYLPLNHPKTPMPSKAPVIPPGATVSDPFMNAVLLFAQLSKTPTLCLFVHGTRVTGGSNDGSLEAVNALGKSLSAVTKLKFNADKSALSATETQSREVVEGSSNMYT